MGKRSRNRSRSRKKKDDRGLFKPAKHKDLAEIVTFESVTKAKDAAEELEELFEKARTRKRRLTILRAAQYAANRARAAAKNPKFKPSTKKRLRKIAEVYEELSEELEDWYHELYD